MELTIRQVQEDDAEGVAAILNRIILARAYTALDTPFTVEEERAFIAQFPQRGLFLAAVAHGRIVGFQNVQPYATYTRAFDHVGVIGTYVDLDLRRQGIAARLFDATFAAAPGKGYEKLFAFVRADNPAALQAYLSRGFEVIGTARGQARIDGRDIDEIFIEKALA